MPPEQGRKEVKEVPKGRLSLIGYTARQREE
jgi:hypothetical protein